MATWEEIRNGIFAGESGGDYNAVYGFQNRPGGRFENVKLTSMPLADVIAFTDPSGEYAQHVKGQIGRVATPVGAYQVVGTTLRAAVKALGLDPSQPFDQATQDRIGQWILENQGTGAWEGYRGPRSDMPRSDYSPAVTGADTAPRDRNPIRLALAYASGKMTPEDAALYEEGMAAGVFPKAEKRGTVKVPESTALSDYAAQIAERQRNRAPVQITPLESITSAAPYARFPGLGA
jgi:hypothetical protein